MVLEPIVDPTDEPRDSSGRVGVPTSETHHRQDRYTLAEVPTRSSHDDLRMAAESVMRTAKILGGASLKVTSPIAMATADRAIAIGGRTAKSVAKWILI